MTHLKQGNGTQFAREIDGELGKYLCCARLTDKTQPDSDEWTNQGLKFYTAHIPDT